MILKSANWRLICCIQILFGEKGKGVRQRTLEYKNILIFERW